MGAHHKSVNIAVMWKMGVQHAEMPWVWQQPDFAVTIPNKITMQGHLEFGSKLTLLSQGKQLHDLKKGLKFGSRLSLLSHGQELHGLQTHLEFGSKLTLLSQGK